MPKRLIAAVAAVLATTLASAGAPNLVQGKLSMARFPPEVTAELAKPETWFVPQLVKPGAQPVSIYGSREAPNQCSFPIRFWGYADTPHTYLANGDLTFHIIKAISYQAQNGRTVFETDNFNVRIDHTHPLKDWKVTGRYGEWHLDSKLVWLEQGPVTVTPTPDGESVHSPHPTHLSKQPDLCKLLAS